MAAISQTDTFKRIFLNENVWISIKISLKFVAMGPINNIPAWRRLGDKPLSAPMMLLGYQRNIGVTRPQSLVPGTLVPGIPIILNQQFPTHINARYLGYFLCNCPQQMP